MQKLLPNLTQPSLTYLTKYSPSVIEWGKHFNHSIEHKLTNTDFKSTHLIDFVNTQVISQNQITIFHFTIKAFEKTTFYTETYYCTLLYSTVCFVRFLFLTYSWHILPSLSLRIFPLKKILKLVWHLGTVCFD